MATLISKANCSSCDRKTKGEANLVFELSEQVPQTESKGSGFS